MRVGIFADVHDHLAHLRLAIDRFNDERVELVLFAGDLVSTISAPPLKRLRAPLVACFGDNEGNKSGLLAGFRLVGKIHEPPVLVQADDGTRFMLAHMKRQLRGASNEYDIAVIGHTHKARIGRDEAGRLVINPGETSGWSFGRSTIVLLETTTRDAKIIELARQPKELEIAERVADRDFSI